MSAENKKGELWNIGRNLLLGYNKRAAQSFTLRGNVPCALYNLLNPRVTGKLPGHVMAKLCGNLLLLSCFLLLGTARAQVTTSPRDSLLIAFQGSAEVEDRFRLFYSTDERYDENSAYDWLDAVKIYANLAQSKQDSLGMRYYKLMEAELYYDIGDYEKSVAFSKELYSEKEVLDAELLEMLLNLFDNNYAKLEDYDKQIEIRKQKQALGITEDITFYDIYAKFGLYRRAMESYVQEEKKKIAEDDYLGQARYHNTLGKFLRLDQSAPTAIGYLTDAKVFVNTFLNDTSRPASDEETAAANLLKGTIDGNVGLCYVQLQQYEEAIPHLENALLRIKENKTSRYNADEIESTLGLAECHIQMGNYELAIGFLDAPFNYSDIDHRIKRNRLYALYYDRIGDFENATRYLKRNVQINDSIDLNYNNLIKQQIGTVVGHDTANKQRQLDQSELLRMQLESEMKAKDEQVSLVFISLVFTLLGFAGLVYAYLKSIKNQRLIAEQKHIIEASLVEKDSLLKEIHHRVKNNLQMVSSLLSLQTKNTRSKAAIEALEEGKSRVKAMALIHQKLYQNDDLSVIEMQGYIESLVNSVQSVFKKGGHNINITIDAEGVELDIDRAIPFGLILNELVSNSFKYAFPDDKENGKIYIHLRKHGEQGFFEYTDNGIGLPEDTEERASGSMGIRLMNRLVNQLQSTLNIDKTSEGVRFWFNFK